MPNSVWRGFSRNTDFWRESLSVFSLDGTRRKERADGLQVVAGLDDFGVLCLELCFVLVTQVLLVDGPGAGSDVVAQVVFETELELARLFLAGAEDTELGGQTLDGSRVDGIGFGTFASSGDVRSEGWEAGRRKGRGGGEGRGSSKCS